MEELTTVRLLADHFEGKPLYEDVPAIRIREGRYRIANSPGLAPGVAAGDEIELTPSERVGYRVLKRGGNVCIQLFLKGRCDASRQSEIAPIIEAIGGRLDGGSDAPAGALLVFTIPVSVGFRAMEAAMATIARAHPVDQWMYGNVYSTKDGKTPLNCWLSDEPT